MGRRQGGQPYITFGYHRRPPARTRAAARGRRPDLRAAAPAADPGRIGKEANQIGKKLFGASHLEAFDLFPMYIYILLWNIFDRFELLFVNGFFIWVYVNIMILWFYGFMDLSNSIIVIYYIRYFWPYYYIASVAPHRCMVAPHRCMIFYQSIRGPCFFWSPTLFFWPPPCLFDPSWMKS